MRNIVVSRYDVPYHWTSVELPEWQGKHLTWLSEARLTWQVNYYIIDIDIFNDKLHKNERKVHFMFEDPNYATLFALRWIS